MPQYGSNSKEERRGRESSLYRRALMITSPVSPFSASQQPMAGTLPRSYDRPSRPTASHGPTTSGSALPSVQEGPPSMSMGHWRRFSPRCPGSTPLSKKSSSSPNHKIPFALSDDFRSDKRLPVTTFTRAVLDFRSARPFSSLQNSHSPIHLVAGSFPLFLTVSILSHSNLLTS